MRQWLLMTSVVLAIAVGILVAARWLGNRSSGFETTTATESWVVTPTARPGPPPHGQRAYDGTVMSAGQERLLLRENMTGTEMAFRVASHASIVRNGEPVALAKLRAGDTARVITDSDGRDMMVTSIEASGMDRAPK